MDARKFREVVQRLELLQTSRQLEDALEKYASISDRFDRYALQYCADMLPDLGT